MSELTTQTEPMTAFKERVIAKLRDDIREMLPDEALAALVQQAVQQHFFQTRSIPQRYGPDEKSPSWFVEEVAKQAEPLVKQCVNQYVEENRETIEEAIKKFLETQNLSLITIGAMRTMTMMDIQDFANEIVLRIKQSY